MKSKKIICGAVAAAIVMSATMTGCISVYNQADMKQTVATVNIGKSEDLGNLQTYADCISDEVIVKRDLISAYVNVGDSYQYGTNGQTFEALMTELVNNAVMVQYATLYVIDYKVNNDSSFALPDFKAKDTEQAKYEYLLGGEDSKGVLSAKYNLYTTLNNALDSYEEQIIEEQDDDGDYKGEGTRTTPSDVDATVDNYYPEKDGKLDYAVYTGYEGYLLDDAGTYEPLDNTNRNTRRKAYSEFITRGLKQNYLLTEADENLTDILKVSYIQRQYLSQLQQSVINEFSDLYEKKQEEKISMVEDGVYTYVQNAYDGQDGLLGEQQNTLTTASSFETAMGSMSDTSFVLYSPSTTGDTELQTGGDTDGTYGTFGYVYNILLPFSVTQNKQLTKLQGYRDDKLIDDSGYFAERNKLLKGIQTTDQRTNWFNGETDYSFNATEAGLDNYFGKEEGRNYLFFENNLTKTSEYKPLDKYIGLYSYNGMVSENKDGSYNLMPNKLDIDGMLAEFSAYIDYVLGSSGNVKMAAGDSLSAGSTNYAKYYETTDFTDTEDKTIIDYSKLVYATGKVDIADKSKENMFVKDGARYKVMSAVNELQYAYTTDTGVLSNYIGYSVSAYDTSYIKEFEYAAQQALRMGVGSFKVCAGDYGWHLIYVTDTFECAGGAVYNPSFTKERVEKEGTFENKFYEWIKDKTLASDATQRRTEIIRAFATDTTVNKNTKAYKDLLELN